MFTRRKSSQANVAMLRPKITFGTRSIVCQETELKGEITIGTVLHPQCKLLAEGGPIILGSDNIVEENVIILDVEGSKIGNQNIVEAKARIIGTTSIGDNCVIGTGCSTEMNETVPNNTVIYGYNHNRRMQANISKPQSTLHARHLDYLREVLPKYNHLKPI
ncbi:hypothetical protein BC937DRAFT_91159 [Endogone sp. FLAS-F59071]|nr:hypothetical protein BC937DRAFT_91159 [Endogone sp. FLAS-F59071]|eukprot:RUS16474.1 hypothetical protein BC937DRAFT_91159 [Endogone sp. FLAS-F59071]